MCQQRIDELTSKNKINPHSWLLGVCFSAIKRNIQPISSCCNFVSSKIWKPQFWLLLLGNICVVFYLIQDWLEQSEADHIKLLSGLTREVAILAFPTMAILANATCTFLSHINRNLQLKKGFKKKKINSFSWLPEALWFGSLAWLELFAEAILVVARRYKIPFLQPISTLNCSSKST